MIRIRHRRPFAGTLVATLGILALLAVGGCGGAAARPSLEPVFVEAVTTPPFGVRETAYDPPRPAPPLRLTDQDGAQFDLERLRGRPVFVYFGYTHCPDICPTTLADIRAALRATGIDAGVVFVTIDPARDDAAAMKQYTDFYDAGYTGLTGTADEIARAAADWGIRYQQLPSTSAGGYAMAHSTDAYLVDSTGTLRHHLFFGAGPELIAKRLRETASP